MDGVGAGLHVSEVTPVARSWAASYPVGVDYPQHHLTIELGGGLEGEGGALRDSVGAPDSLIVVGLAGEVERAKAVPGSAIKPAAMRVAAIFTARSRSFAAESSC